MATKRGGKWARMSMTNHTAHKHQELRIARNDGRPREVYDFDGDHHGSRVDDLRGDERTNCWMV